MKTLIFTAALPLLACAVRGQDVPPPKDAPAETVKKARAAAWLGVAMAESDDKVVIGQVVPGSPAAKAGLKDGDRILRIGDTAIEGQMQRVSEKVGQHKPGDTIELRFLRGDKEETAKIELAERPAQLDGDFRGEFRRAKEKLEKTIKEKVKDSKKKFEDKIELDPFKDHPRPELSLENKKPDPKKGEPDGEKLFRYYFDKEWRADKTDGKWDEPELRLGFKPLKKGSVKFLELKKKSGADSEAAIWKRVQESIAHSLKRSDIGPDLVEKVMKAVEEARRTGSEKDARRAKLEAEAANLEKEMQSLKERSSKVREELKKAAE